MCKFTAYRFHVYFVPKGGFYIEMNDNKNTVENYEFPLFVFHEGNNCEAFNFFGAHKAVKDGVEGAYFRVWAPKAKSVSLIGDFNGWDRSKTPMYRLDDF